MLPPHFWDKVDKSGECWIWTASLDTRGYGQVGVKRQLRLSHRLSWEVVHGPIPAGMEICHRCDRPACINPDHLFMGTHADNMRDMSLKGRGPRGERAGLAKLNAECVKVIRFLRARGVSSRRLAAAHGVTYGPIDQIVRRVTWKHVA